MSAKAITSFIPPTFDVKAPKGFSSTLPLTFKDSGTAIDITPDSFTLTVKDADAVVIDTLTLGSGIEFGAGDGELLITFDSPVTDDATVLYYLLEWERGANVVPVLRGAINVVDVWPV